MGQKPVEKTGTPQTLASINEAKFYYINFYDERGRLTPIIAMRLFDGTVLMPPNAEEWADKLRPATKWFATELNKRLKDSEPLQNLDTADDVEVLDIPKDE